MPYARELSAIGFKFIKPAAKPKAIDRLKRRSKSAMTMIVQEFDGSTEQP